MNRNCFDWLTISPQEAAGGCTPTPRKLSVLSASMQDGTFNVYRTISDGTQRGRTWRIIIFLLFTPIERAASTNVISFRLSAWERTTRATLAQPAIESAAVMHTSELAYLPSVYMTTMESSSEGIESSTSATRMMK